MTEFIVRLANRPGALARVTELLAEAEINIEALAAWGLDGEGLVRLIVDNADLTRDVLSTAGLGFEEHRVLATSLPHRPGELAKVCRRLADAGVNIDAMYLLRSGPDGLELALSVDEPDEAEPHLPVVGSAESLTPRA